jgi:hypothetical protein
MGEKMKLISKATFQALLVTAVLFLVPAAHADSYLDYQINGVFQSGGTLGGYFVIDTTTNMVTGGVMTADNETFTCPDGYPNGCSLSSAVGFLSAPGLPSGYTQLDLNWLPSSPSSGFNFTLNNSYCAYCTPVPGALDGLTSGSAVMFGTDAAPSFNNNSQDPVSTPEPTSGILLSLGLIGLGFAGLKQRSAVNNA